MKKVVKKMVKKVAMFEKLKQGMLEEIIVKACDFLINDCDTCPKFISSRCKESCNEMRLRRLRTEAKIMTNIEKLKRKIIYKICYEVDDCDKCPAFLSNKCKAEEAEAEAKATMDAFNSGGGRYQ